MQNLQTNLLRRCFLARLYFVVATGRAASGRSPHPHQGRPVLPYCLTAGPPEHVDHPESLDRDLQVLQGFPIDVNLSLERVEPALPGLNGVEVVEGHEEPVDQPE